VHLVPAALPDSIFRAYDIRGVVGKTLHAETAYWIGRAIGTEPGPGRTARFGRPRRPPVRPDAGRTTDQRPGRCGCHVSDVGLVPTPALYYAANVLAGKSGVMLTGSHNPSDYNGFKIVIAGDTLANEQIQALLTRLKTNDLTSGEGRVKRSRSSTATSSRSSATSKLARRLKVVVDCGNGAAGVIAPQLIEALNCEVIPLFCEVDGNFPNHHPDPGKPENLEDLIAKVKETGADIGLAFDGDGDRVGVVTNTGSIVYPTAC
jgi:phosphomannomutase/phosphoglucomutase